MHVRRMHRMPGVQVVRAVDEQQLGVADVPLREPPAPASPAPPFFHTSVHAFLRELPDGSGQRRLASGSMTLSLAPLSYWQARKERQRISDVQRAAANTNSQRAMLHLQLKARRCPLFAPSALHRPACAHTHVLIACTGGCHVAQAAARPCSCRRRKATVPANERRAHRPPMLRVHLSVLESSAVVLMHAGLRRSSIGVSVFVHA